MRIAFIGARGVVGKYSGIETYYEEVGSRLVALGHEVTAYCRTYFTPPLKSYRGMRIRRLPTLRTKHLDTIVHSLLCTVDAVFRRYDIVQYHALGSAPLAIVPRGFGTKTVVSVRGLDWERTKWGGLARRYLRATERAAVRCPTATAVVSRNLAAHFQRVHGADVAYIPNGVTVKPRTAPDRIRDWGLAERSYVLYVGRLTPEKGCHLLIEAFRQLDTNLQLVFVGGSTYADDYVRTLRQHESERIRFLGFQGGSVLQELYSNAYVFVLPSSIEGLSIALLEAMSYGNCVLTSDIPQNLELVERHGFAFANGSVSDLRDRLRFLLDNPRAAEASGNANRDTIARHYTWDVIAGETAAFFRAVLDSSESR